MTKTKIRGGEAVTEQEDSGSKGRTKPKVEFARLESPRISRAAAVLARAFQYDPMMAYLIPDERQRAAAAPGFFRDIVNYCLRYGEVYTPPEVEGVACWLPPGETKVRTGRLLGTGGLWTPLTLGLPAFSRLMALMSHLEVEHERNAPEPHWYLYVLGAEPLSRGRGIGRALLRPALEQADDFGQPCYLETQNERNVPVYEGLGFRLTSESVRTAASGRGPCAGSLQGYMEERTRRDERWSILSETTRGAEVCGRSTIARSPGFGRGRIRGDSGSMTGSQNLGEERMRPRSRIVSAISVLAPVALSGIFLVVFVPQLWWIFTTYFWIAFPALGSLRQGLVEAVEAKPRQVSDRDVEQELLVALRRHGGLTSTLAAAETSLSVAEADKRLGELAGEGHLEVRARGGPIFYALWESEPGAQEMPRLKSGEERP